MSTSLRMTLTVDSALSATQIADLVTAGTLPGDATLTRDDSGRIYFVWHVSAA